ncbi:MAG: hypothetical protein ACOYXW_07470 [Actinomycetota bacterium]
MDGRKVSFEGHTVFPSAGSHEVAAITLQFRTRTEIETGLVDAGFTVVAEYGSWDRQMLSPDSPEMIFAAVSLADEGGGIP